MTWHIKPDILWCVADARPVFLDLATQRYFTLPAHHVEVFANWPCQADDPAADFTALPMFVSEAPAPDDWRLALRPSTDFPRIGSSQTDTFAQSPYFSLVPWAFVCHALARILLRTSPFASSVSRLVARRRKALAATSRSHRWNLQRAAASFDVTSRVLKSHDRCLQTSVAQSLFLWTLGHSPNLVLGVKMTPWAAHAWVQNGPNVLNDDPDRVRSFTPILVV